MRTASGGLAGVAVAFLGFLLQPTAGWACTCAVPPFPLEVEQTPVIFSGVVSRVTDASPGCDELSLEVEIISSAWWKGTPTDTVLVYTSRCGSATCGVHFDVGREWIVFAFHGAQKLVTGTCSSTHATYPGDPMIDWLGPPLSVQALSSSWGRIKSTYR